MKFENPKMNISMFEVENVVTVSNNALNQAVEQVETLIAGDASFTSPEVVTFVW